MDPQANTEVQMRACFSTVEAATAFIDGFNEWARNEDVEALFSRTTDTPSGQSESDYRIELKQVRWVVGVSVSCTRLRKFATEDEAVAFVGTLEGVEDGIYYVEPFTEGG